MCYTHGPIARYAHCDRTLQIFSIQVVRIKKGLEWPLHVYGLVAVRDSVDHNRNLLFHRTRDDCQILTQKVEYHPFLNYLNYLYFLIFICTFLVAGTIVMYTFLFPNLFFPLLYLKFDKTWNSLSSTINIQITLLLCTQ